MGDPIAVDLALPIIEQQPALWFVFHEEKILLINTPTGLQIPLITDSRELDLHLSQVCRFGTYGAIACISAQAMQALPPPNMSFQPLRQSYAAINNQELFFLAIKAIQVSLWDKRTQFCGCCSAKTVISTTEPMKQCPVCNALFYSQISPVMLVLIWRKEEILLARAAHYPHFYSLLAGFVEPGETLEQCVVREIKEEVDIQIKNLTYVASAPWPFPSNLMLGFLAEYASGEIKTNPTELEEAQWFSIKKLPVLPSPMSLARRMIDAHVASFDNR